MLNSPMWNVVASVTQIIAAIFGLITILQARKMMAQADFQIRQSVAPAWDINSRIMSPENDHKKMNHDVMLPFTNTGLGPARNCVIGFSSKNGNKPIQADGIGILREPIFPDTTHTLRLYWDCDKPLDGILTITSTTRLGYIVKHRFHLRTYLDAQNAHNGWCDINPIYEK